MKPISSTLQNSQEKKKSFQKEKLIKLLKINGYLEDGFHKVLNANSIERIFL